MTAQIIPFPGTYRPHLAVPLHHHPLYRKGVEDFLTHILREQGNADPRGEAQRLAEHTLGRLDPVTELPVCAGEGECS